MTEKDAIIQDMRREFNKTKEENQKLLKRISEQEIIIAIQQEWIDRLEGKK